MVIAARGIRGRHVLEAMRAVPRDRFVPDPLGEFAYEDTPLPIEAGQTISQPYILAHMIEAAAITPGDRVLEIGAGPEHILLATIPRVRSRHQLQPFQLQAPQGCTQPHPPSQGNHLLSITNEIFRTG